MVFMVLHRHYTAFPNVRIAILPQDDGEPGELRIAIVGTVQHKIYSPKSDLDYTYISIRDIDVNQLDLIGCDAQVITVKGYEYWFRFPTDADATIFYRLLCERLDVAESIFDEDEEDYWEEGPWTLNDTNHENLECRCHCHGHIRYAADYSL